MKQSTELGKALYVENQGRHFGSSTGWYALWIEKNGKTLDLMLTESDIQVLHERAINNPEDMPRLKKPGFFQRFFNLFK